MYVLYFSLESYYRNTSIVFDVRDVKCLRVVELLNSKAEYSGVERAALNILLYVGNSWKKPVMKIFVVAYCNLCFRRQQSFFTFFRFYTLGFHVNSIVLTKGNIGEILLFLVCDCCGRMLQWKAFILVFRTV